MKHSEFAPHHRFICDGTEYICTDIGKRTIIAVPFSDVREDYWLYSPPYPGAMTESVFDENDLPKCEPFYKPAVPTPPQKPTKPPTEKSTPPLVPGTAFPQMPPFPPLRLLVIATTFCVLGIGSLIYCVSSSLHTRAFLARATRVNATVVSVEDSTDTKQHHRYTPTFVFADATGKTWTNTSSQSEDSPRRIGEEMAVLYDSQNPAEARIESFLNAWGTPLASGLTGLLMLGAGAAVGRHFSALLRKANGSNPVSSPTGSRSSK